jgi:hypothetical protein
MSIFSVASKKLDIPVVQGLHAEDVRPTRRSRSCHHRSAKAPDERVRLHVECDDVRAQNPFPLLVTLPLTLPVSCV